MTARTEFVAADAANELAEIWRRLAELADLRDRLVVIEKRLGITPPPPRYLAMLPPKGWRNHDTA